MKSFTIILQTPDDKFDHVDLFKSDRNGFVYSCLIHNNVIFLFFN